ncbi:hypothetical protein HZA75_07635 [Candidatus Roizmanbacteria bacterium]|nr:hypothetical protein [Candidatus Roizmanbacteria bacterium]
MKDKDQSAKSSEPSKVTKIFSRRSAGEPANSIEATARRRRVIEKYEPYRRKINW